MSEALDISSKITEYANFGSYSTSMIYDSMEKSTKNRWLSEARVSQNATISRSKNFRNFSGSESSADTGRSLKFSVWTFDCLSIWTMYPLRMIYSDQGRSSLF